MMEIVHRYTSAVLYKSTDAVTLCEAVIAAVKSGASLSRANLSEANLYGANLSGTVLQPDLPTNKHGDFEEVDGWCIGYRTRTSQHCGSTTYKDGETYTAEVFSVCPLTACHPGLYAYPRFDDVTRAYPNVEVIKVRFRRNDLHSAGGKYRVRTFEVLETV